MNALFVSNLFQEPTALSAGWRVTVVLPLIGFLVKICNLIFPIKEKEKVKVRHLEPHLLNTPSVALEQVIDSIRYMSKESWSMVRKAMKEAFFPAKIDKNLVKEMSERENKIGDASKGKHA